MYIFYYKVLIYIANTCILFLEFRMQVKKTNALLLPLKCITKLF